MLKKFSLFICIVVMFVVPFISQAEEELEELYDDGTYISERYIELVHADDPDSLGTFYVGWMTMSEESQMVGEVISSGSSAPLAMIGEFIDEDTIEAYIYHEDVNDDNDDRKFTLKIIKTLHYKD